MMWLHGKNKKKALLITTDDKDNPGKESIFALKRTEWLHDAIITLWFGHWCDMIQGVSSYSINQHAQEQQKKTHWRPAERLHGGKKVFFTSPYFWSYVQDGQHKGANQTHQRHLYLLQNAYFCLCQTKTLGSCMHRFRWQTYFVVWHCWEWSPHKLWYFVQVA
jgi:hypothetical protein